MRNPPQLLSSEGNFAYYLEQERITYTQEYEDFVENNALSVKEAFDLSIEKYEFIADVLRPGNLPVTSLNLGPYACGLCQYTLDVSPQSYLSNCYVCPLYTETQAGGNCENTPYAKIAWASGLVRQGNLKRIPLGIVLDEVEYLKEAKQKVLGD